MIVYLDLDGVFADFDRKLHALGSYRGDPNRWAIIEQVPNFFLNLHVIPNSMLLWDHLITKRYPLAFLTASPKPTKLLVTSIEDKVQWVRKNISRDVPVIVTDGWESKTKYCHDGDILIDDMPRNVYHWEQAGGIGILHEPSDVLATIQMFEHVVSR